MSKEGDQFGTTYQKSSPAITFPKASSAPSYGSKKKFVPAHGGDQYGVTITKSNPAVDFPSSKPAFMGGKTRGY